MNALAPNTIPVLDQVAAATANETARQKFTSTLRKVVLVDVGGEMGRAYHEDVGPTLAAKGAEPKDGLGVRKAMLDRQITRFFSAARYNAQEMTWSSVRPQLEREMPKLEQAARLASEVNPAGGTLTLDPSVETPRYVSEVDVHLMPGCFQTEYSGESADVAQGALYSYGSRVFSGGLKLSTVGGPAWTIAKALKFRFPDFHPKAILDIGCTTGRGTQAFVETFPDAEVYGIDVAAPVLRYAHANFEGLGLKAHFRQENAEKMRFADNSLDLITSSFFFHELPLPATRKVLAECHRVLKPGGLMLHFELPPSMLVDAYYDYWLNWDTYYNNEPSYAAFRGSDPRELVTGAGFKPEDYLTMQLRNWGTVSEDEFAQGARGEVEVKIAPHGYSWFTFGAWKR